MATCVNFGQQQYFGFDPRTIPSMAVWYDAADSTTTILSGSTVTAWNDKSGNGRNATASGTPTLTTNALNGLPVITFNGLNQWMSSPLSLGSTQPLTLFVVARSTTTTGFRAAVSLNAVPGARGNSLMLYVSGTGFWWFSGGSGATDGNTSTLAVSTSRYDINANYWRPSFVQMNINGTAYASSTSTPSSLTASSTMIIGRAQGSIEYWSGTIAEIIVYADIISQSQRQQVEGYLAEKWGLRSNLVTTHPYRTIPPVVRLFQPVDVSGSILWLDAADTTTITGSPVTQWTDKSGRGSNAVTGLGSVVAGTAINSRNTLRFGSNVTLNLSNFVMPSAQTSVFYVFRGATTNPNAGAGTGYFIFSRTADNFSVFSGNEQFASYQNPPASRAYVLVMGPNGERNWGNLPVAAFFNNVNVISTTGISYASSNGLSLPQVAGSNVSNSVLTATTYQISTSRGFADVYSYDLGELIVCDGTSSTAVAQQMEGYLAWKWGVQGSLPATHPYRSVLPSTAQFVPHAISNCALWFDAADTATITGTTQVTSWTNKGTLGGNATNLTGSCTSGATVNGLNYIRCPAGTSLQFTAALNTQARSWFVVARQVTVLTSGTFAGIVNQQTGGAQDAVVIAFVNSTTNNIYIGPSGVAIRVAADVPSALLYTVFLTSIINGTTAQNVMTVNGTGRTLTSSSAAASYRTTSSTYQLGTSGYNTTVDLMEVIFYYGAVSLNERQRVEGYLAWKWGLQSTLPSTHPYVKFRP